MLPQVSQSPVVRVPKLGVHKATGQARVVVEGRSYYLGKAGPEATARYRALLATYLRDGVPEDPVDPVANDELQRIHSWRESVGVQVDVDSDQAHPRNRVPGCELNSCQLPQQAPALAIIIPPFRRESPTS